MLRRASLPRESWLTQRPAHSEFAAGIAESGQFVVAFHHGTISTWQERFCNAGKSTASKPAQVTLPQDEHILLAAADRIPLGKPEDEADKETLLPAWSWRQ